MKKVFIAGHTGMVGKALLRKLKTKKNIEIITKSRSDLDLTNQNDVKNFFKKNKIDEVLIAAAKVGGIFANNTYPADFIYENLQIQNNIIHSAHLSDIQKLLFLGSSCIYPKFSNQPISEKSLLSGYLESTNQPYAIAKIAGLIMCDSFNKQYNRDYRVVMPTNLYGPGDNFHSCNSHVIPSLISRINKAKNNNSQKVEIWGTGKVMREFLFVDDMADACVFVMNLSKKKLREKLDLTNLHINVGTGKDISIKKLALLIKKIIGYEGKLYFDPFKPEGTPRKLLNVDVLTKLGWSYKVSLEEGLKISYQWYLRNYS